MKAAVTDGRQPSQNIPATTERSVSQTIYSSCCPGNCCSRSFPKPCSKDWCKPSSNTTRLPLRCSRVPFDVENRDRRDLRRLERTFHRRPIAHDHDREVLQ